MVCPERARLLIGYRDAVRRYSETVQDLVDLMMEASSDSELLRRRAREAWDASEKARVALTRHEGNHFCDRGGFA
jgi:hypothetical protein